MTLLAGLLALACLTVGAYHALRLAVLRADPPNEAAHAAMGVGMAAMFSPVGDPLPAPVWTVVFLLFGAWFAALALRSPADRPDAVPHVVGSAAMLFMLFGAHGGGVAGTGAVHQGHVGHGGGPEGGLGWASVAAILLAGYVAWHGLRCADGLRTPPVPPATAVAVRTSILRDVRTLAAAHAVLATAMAVMLLGMV